MRMPPELGGPSIWECQSGPEASSHSVQVEASRLRHTVSPEASSPAGIRHLDVYPNPVPLRSRLQQASLVQQRSRLTGEVWGSLRRIRDISRTQGNPASGFRMRLRLSSRTLFRPECLAIRCPIPERELDSLNRISPRVPTRHRVSFIRRRRAKDLASTGTGSCTRLRLRPGTTKPASPSIPNTTGPNQLRCGTAFEREEHWRLPR